MGDEPTLVELELQKIQVKWDEHKSDDGKVDFFEWLDLIYTTIKSVIKIAEKFIAMPSEKEKTDWIKLQVKEIGEQQDFDIPILFGPFESAAKNFFYDHIVGAIIKALYDKVDPEDDPA